MNVNLRWWLIMVISLMGSALSACNSNSGEASQTAAADAIQTYLTALVAKDRDTFQTLLCAEYEAAGMTEFDSFGAVQATLVDAACAVSESDGDQATVRCTGKIDIVYDGERNASLDLMRSPYLVAREDGVWRMCGYQN